MFGKPTKSRAREEVIAGLIALSRGQMRPRKRVRHRAGGHVRVINELVSLALINVLVGRKVRGIASRTASPSSIEFARGSF